MCSEEKVSEGMSLADLAPDGRWIFKQSLLPPESDMPSQIVPSSSGYFLYVQGYTAALQDVLSTFESLNVSGDLKRHKRKQNYKTYKAIVECMLKNRAILRENPDAFIRCNDNADNGFELWIEGKR